MASILVTRGVVGWMGWGGWEWLTSCLPHQDVQGRPSHSSPRLHSLVMLLQHQQQVERPARDFRVDSAGRRDPTCPRLLSSHSAGAGVSHQVIWATRPPHPTPLHRCTR